MPSIYCVIGAPCSGKSTYVKENAKSGDVIVDYDLIALALGSDAPHQSTGDIRRCAFVARSAVIDEVLSGVDHDAWIIHTSPKSEDIERYKEFGAEFVNLDPGMDVCIDRAKDRPDGTVDLIRQWYDQNKPKSLASMIMLMKI